MSNVRNQNAIYVQAGISQELSANWVPWVIFFSIMINVATVYMTQPIMTLLSRNFSVSVAQISIATSVVTSVYALSFVVYGSFSDKYGRRKFLLYGALGLALITACIGLVSNFRSFLWLTAIQGVVAGSLPSVAIPYMADITPRERIGQAMGIALSGTVAGTVMGRSISGMVAQLAGWRVTYLVYGVLLLLIFILLMRLPRSNTVNAHISVSKALFNMISLFGNMKVLPLIFVGALLFFSYLGSATFLTPYLSSAPFNLGPGIIGLLSLCGIAGILASPAAGKLVVKYGSYPIMTTGIFIVLAAIQLMAYIKSIPVVLVGLLLLYTGVFVCQPAVLSLVATAAGQERRGGGSSLYLLACMGGGSIGVSVLRPIYISHSWIGTAEASSISCVIALVIAVAYALTASIKAARIKKASL